MAEYTPSDIDKTLAFISSEHAIIPSIESSPTISPLSNESHGSRKRKALSNPQVPSVEPSTSDTPPSQQQKKVKLVLKLRPEAAHSSTSDTEPSGPKKVKLILKLRPEGTNTSKEQARPDSKAKSTQSHTTMASATVSQRPAPVLTPHQPIYVSETSNPLLAYAITQLAVQNNPSISFRSALEHIPNVGPADPEPELTSPGRKFLGDRAYARRPTDVKIQITFHPHYYRDGRHGIGYSVPMPYRLRNGRYVELRGARTPTAMVYTPCNDADLTASGLVKIVRREEVFAGMSGQEEGREGMADKARKVIPWESTAVGVAGGKWVSKTSGKAEWTALHTLIAKDWEARMHLAEGGYEELDIRHGTNLGEQRRSRSSE